MNPIKVLNALLRKRKRNWRKADNNGLDSFSHPADDFSLAPALKNLGWSKTLQTTFYRPWSLHAFAGDHADANNDSQCHIADSVGDA
jgi:hypothetical protein